MIRYKKNSSLIQEKMSDSERLLMFERNGEMKTVYIANVAVDILEMCTGKNDINQIVDGIFAMYDVEYDKCKKDVEECINQFEKNGIIVLINEQDMMENN